MGAATAACRAFLHRCTQWFSASLIIFCVCFFAVIIWIIFVPVFNIKNGKFFLWGESKSLSVEISCVFNVKQKSTAGVVNLSYKCLWRVEGGVTLGGQQSYQRCLAPRWQKLLLLQLWTELLTVAGCCFAAQLFHGVRSTFKSKYVQIHFCFSCPETSCQVPEGVLTLGSIFRCQSGFCSCRVGRCAASPQL